MSMLSILADRRYRHLFAAQAVALVGTGLATVALGLLAFEIAGGEAGAVLGTALAIKMLAYVGIAPIASAAAERLPRRAMLVGLDLVRVAVALLLPFVDEVWQIYVLIFVLQSASAAFVPAFQATIPDILPEEADYTRALSLSRLAYDLESLASPLLAAALLTVVSFQALFAGTAVGFLASAILIVSVALPGRKPPAKRPIFERTTLGVRLYLATPRLRGLLAVNMAVAAAGAMVIVNTVVIVQGDFGLTQQSTALAMAAFGGGSMVAALLLPRLLEALADRMVMLAGVVVMIAGLLVAAVAVRDLAALLCVWFVLGLGYSAAQTPTGRLLRRSSHAEERPALFAAQFPLSHACWLLAYPLAGWLGAAAGLSATFLVLAALAAVALAIAVAAWPAVDPQVVAHRHPRLAEDDPHWRAGARTPGGGHAHRFVIDDLHPRWPNRP